MADEKQKAARQLVHAAKNLHAAGEHDAAKVATALANLIVIGPVYTRLLLTTAADCVASALATIGET